jgi:hypothetical protein
MPQDWNYGTDHMGIASRALGRLREGSERYGRFRQLTPAPVLDNSDDPAHAERPNKKAGPLWRDLVNDAHVVRAAEGCRAVQMSACLVENRGGVGIGAVVFGVGEAV